MKTIPAHIFFALAAMLLAPFIAEPMDIHQQPYTFQMDVTQEMTCTTFVIAEQRSGKLPAVSCQLSRIYFEVGSSIISPAATTSILSDLQRCQIGPKDVLRVTGHTCNLGSEKINQELAQQRAESVAAFLRVKGFTVAEVKGTGSQNPVSSDPQEIFKNRRVEIDLLRSEKNQQPINE